MYECCVLGTFTVMSEVICRMMSFSPDILNSCVNRTMGGSVAATHQPAESNGHH